MNIYSIIKSITITKPYKPYYAVITVNLWDIVKIFWRPNVIWFIRDIYNYLTDEHIFFSKYKAQQTADKLNENI